MVAHDPSALAWLGRHQLALLLMLALAAAGTWAFVALAGKVARGDTQAFDEALLLMLRNPGDASDPLGPKWLEEMMRDFTALGGVGVLGIITLVVSGFLVLGGKRRAALFLLITVVSGLLLSFWLKHRYERPRPHLVPHGSYVASASFPSGHSMIAAVTYLTLGSLLARVQPRRTFQAYLLIVAALLTALVGCSRVYLGVHWPTDVLAGWTVGAVWAILCWAAAKWLQDRGQLERPRGAARNE
jgi:undecaprenyl-diphosphatase